MARAESHPIDKHRHFISADTVEKTALEKLLIFGFPWGI